MQNLVYVLPLLACPVGMGVMMWYMNRGMSGQNSGATGQSKDAQQPGSFVNRRATFSSSPGADLTDDTQAEQLADLRRQLAEVEDQQQSIARAIAHLDDSREGARRR